MTLSLREKSPVRPATQTTPAQQLRTTMAAARISFTWLGVRKSLNAQQKNQAADAFGAEGKYLSAGKKLLDTTHPAFKQVTSVKGRCLSYWRAISLPYPEPGIRLIRQSAVTEFDQQLAQYCDELETAVAGLDEHFGELRTAARRRLGNLYSAEDYPRSLLGLFAIDHDFPSVEPPAYLQQLNPELYQQECRRMQARFDAAVQLAETAFVDELSKLVDHLHERLRGADGGQTKVFRDSAVTNLTEFLTRFRTLSIRSDLQLEQLVNRCQELVGGVEPQQLRDDQRLRKTISTQLAGVQSALDGLLVDRPRRNILRRPR
ncbi:hypothetical protein [Planctomicrobium piriforme]|uniref:DUF3150 domain-containing protein n=1 Tax=Planctomicrobium piriforme TaxID=1576369 RepID=A0A1I3S005_9PLAN|nr:hypothetical protein [Planctomicrobium piriforme]SFJ51640.1 hypothetical protein SAMN05421753_12252 [Planctomicrobium piriforme]